MSTKKDIQEKIIGKEFIKSIVSSLPNDSGIYKMIDSKGKIIYIGKAKNLKNRVYSYSNNNLMPRTEFMVSQIHYIEWQITNNEQDALFLESNLIKSLKPKYNILLKDDKTFPFIKIETKHNFPRISKIRSKSGTPNSDTFGPFASSLNVDETIKTLQKMFLLRNCSDNSFSNRRQPCILYQIKRCSAPCVGKIIDVDYKNNVKQAISFLKGNNEKLKHELAQNMLKASKENDFEKAIIFRDRIKSLAQLSSSQSTMLSNNETADFLGLIEHDSNYVFGVFMFKNGHHYGSLYFPTKIQLEENIQDAFASFIIQFYENRDIPKNLYINIPKDEKKSKILESYLEHKKQKKVTIQNPKNKQQSEIIEILIKNSFDNLTRYAENSLKWQKHFEELENFFGINKKITKIEIYDNSHLYGTYSLGVLVSARVWGFEKKEYRTFNLKDETTDSRDDYGILKHVLYRRFSRMLKEKQDAPELVLIDGGKGQLSIAKDVLSELNITDIKLVAIAKGANRNSGEETLFLDTGEEIKPNKFSSTLHFLQLLRNEAHRYAIKSVSKRKIASLEKSELDMIPDIGKKRKQLLLNYFGSIEKIKSASIDELSKVKGIKNDIAKNIFNFFH